MYNRNSVEFLNRADPYKYSKVYNKIRELKELIERNGYDRSRFIIDSSAVLEAYGLRQAADLDFLTDYVFEEENQIEEADNHRSQLPYHNVSLLEMLYDPENYFYFEGMKFLAPQRLIEMKTNRGEMKDIKDVRMLKKIICKNLHIPKEYRYQTLDKIHQYQIAHHLYGEGAYNYEKYKSRIKQDRISKVISVVWGSLSAVYHSFFDKYEKRLKR